MNSSTIQQAQKTIEDFNNYIAWVIEKMIKTEYDFLMKKGIYSVILEEGTTGSWFHTFKRPPFSDSSKYKLVLRYEPKKYKFVEFKGETVIIEWAQETFTVPLQLTDSTFNDFFANYHKDLEENIAKFKAKQIERKKKADIEKKKMDKLLGLHHDGKYSYQWKECERCNRDGYIIVGTGVWKHQGDYDREGYYIESEVKERRTCPCCQGAGGFIHYTDDGTDNLFHEKPCRRYIFEEHQDDFTQIMLHR